MGDKSTIEWTEATWNPITGCSKVGPGCAHCYAETLTRRFADVWGVPDLPWTPANAEANVILHPERLDAPLRWKRPRMIFVNSMSDLFHELVLSDYIARVFAVMAVAERHTFQVLTKRPGRMRSLLSNGEFWLQVSEYVEAFGDDDLAREIGIAGADAITVWLKNVWLGTSIENRRYVDRADELRATPAAVRFISAEPLLGPLLHDDWKTTDACGEGYSKWRDGADLPELNLAGIDWLIVGGESGAGHRPMKVEWVRALRDRALAFRCEWREGGGCILNGCDGSACRPDLAFFFKQHGGARPKANGRELDGRTWDEMPAGPA